MSDTISKFLTMLQGMLSKDEQHSGILSKDAKVY